MGIINVLTSFWNALLSTELFQLAFRMLSKMSVEYLLALRTFSCLSMELFLLAFRMFTWILDLTSMEALGKHCITQQVCVLLELQIVGNKCGR